jgi:hypothetical protein
MMSTSKLEPTKQKLTGENKNNLKAIVVPKQKYN